MFIRQHTSKRQFTSYKFKAMLANKTMFIYSKTNMKTIYIICPDRMKFNH